MPHAGCWALVDWFHFLGKGYITGLVVFSAYLSCCKLGSSIPLPGNWLETCSQEDLLKRLGWGVILLLLLWSLHCLLVATVIISMPRAWYSLSLRWEYLWNGASEGYHNPQRLSSMCSVDCRHWLWAWMTLTGQCNVGSLIIEHLKQQCNTEHMLCLVSLY